MKKGFIFLGCLLITFYNWAQSDPNARLVRDNSVINAAPPSPEMANLGKYGELQISRSTGAPSVGIPIYTITVDGVSIPLGLQFASNGFRPSDVGSYLGMHWILTGLGGISRSIRGTVDEGGYLSNSVNQSYVNSVNSSINSATTQSNLSTMNNGGDDISQDAYLVSTNNINGKFFINSNKQFEWSVKSDNKLNHQVFTSGGINHIKFWIFDTKGNRYNFETEELTYVSSQNGYSRTTVTQDGVTAWKLTKIITAKGREINFSYTDYQFTYTAPSQDVFTTESDPPTSPNSTENCGCSTTEVWKYGTNQYNHHTKVISSITTDRETIEFNYTTDYSAANYQKKLTQILVKNSSNVTQKIFDFTYGYFSGNARLKLTEFKQTDVNSVLDPVKHNFTYYENYGIVATTSRAIDSHKFYNGATSNWHLIVSSHSRFWAGSADRSVQPAYSQETMLKEIIYPTGGKSEFIYEANGDVSANDLGPGLRVKEIKDRDVNGTLLRHKEFVFRTYNGLPLLDNNVPAEVFPDYILCNRVQFTSDAQYSIAGNTIPLSEEFYYSEMDELQKGSPDLKNTYKFTNAGAMEGDLQIRPLQDLVYKHNGSSYVLVQQKDYEYSITGYGTYSYSVNQFAVNPAFQQTYVTYDESYSEWCVLYYNGIAAGLPRYQTRIRNSRIKVKMIDGSDNLETITDLSYGSNHEMPTGITSTNSKGQTEQKNIYYPSEGSSVSSPSLSSPQLTVLSGMVTANMLDFPIAQERYVASSLVDATRTHYDLYHSLYYLPKEVFDYDGSSYNSRTELLSYDTDGNLTASRKANDYTSAYIWDYQKSFLIAEVKNAAVSDIAYTSFETSVSGGWSGVSGSNYVATAGATGARYYSQSGFSLSKSSLNSGIAYYVTYWSTSGSAYSISGTAGGWPKSIGSVTIGSTTWYGYQHKVTGQSTITVTGSGDIDELRVCPAAALMTTYTYHPIYGISTQNDSNNRITYYQYDGLGRLTLIRDQQQNIIKRFEYKYNVLPNQ